MQIVLFGLLALGLEERSSVWRPEIMSEKTYTREIVVKIIPVSIKLVFTVKVNAYSGLVAYGIPIKVLTSPGTSMSRLMMNNTIPDANSNPLPIVTFR